MCPGEHNTTCSECQQETCLECNRYCEVCDDQFCLDHLEPEEHTCLDDVDYGDVHDDLGGDPYYRNPKQFGPKKLEAIRLCRETSMTYRNIAQKIGASAKTVSNWCIEAGARQRQPRQRLSIRQRETLYPHRTSSLRQEMKSRWDKQATPSRWPRPTKDIEKARRMRIAGASFAEIALELGITWNEARRLDY
jgi:transposase-like protein